MKKNERQSNCAQIIVQIFFDHYLFMQCVSSNNYSIIYYLVLSISPLSLTSITTVMKPFHVTARLIGFRRKINPGKVRRLHAVLFKEKDNINEEKIPLSTKTANFFCRTVLNGKF